MLPSNKCDALPCFLRFYVTYTNEEKKKRIPINSVVFPSSSYSLYHSGRRSLLPSYSLFCQRVAFACYYKLCFLPYAITCQPRKYIIKKKRKRDSRTMAMCASENNCQSQLHALKDKKGNSGLETRLFLSVNTLN